MSDFMQIPHPFHTPSSRTGIRNDREWRDIGKRSRAVSSPVFTTNLLAARLRFPLAYSTLSFRRIRQPAETEESPDLKVLNK